MRLSLCNKYTASYNLLKAHNIELIDDLSFYAQRSKLFKELWVYTRVL